MVFDSGKGCVPAEGEDLIGGRCNPGNEEPISRDDTGRAVGGSGDCGDDVILTAAVLKRLGFDAALLYYPGHCALGVAGADGLHYEQRNSRSEKGGVHADVRPDDPACPGEPS